MSDWGWVAFGYVVMYGILGAYVGWLAYRIRLVRRKLRESS